MRLATKDVYPAPSYLREQATRCVRLARDCPHTPTAHQLEEIAVDLMEKAAALDDLLSDRPMGSQRT
jgi:hypothetical protein